MDEVLTAIAEAVSTLIIAFADSEGTFSTVIITNGLSLIIHCSIEKNKLFADMVPAAEAIQGAVGGKCEIFDYVRKG